VEVSLDTGPVANSLPLFRGETDGRGVSQVVLPVPSGQARDGRLKVRVASPAGEQVFEQPVQLVERFSTYLTTDKPLY
jgi:hypothetical protein